MGVGYGVGMTRASCGRSVASINNTNGLLARKQFIADSCATDTGPNHHDVMVLGIGHE
jgi:hypothetical protein